MLLLKTLENIQPHDMICCATSPVLLIPMPLIALLLVVVINDIVDGIDGVVLLFVVVSLGVVGD